MSKRVFIIVLDSLGIGAEPDAAAFGDPAANGDVGSNTLGAIRNHPAFHCPHLAQLGLFHIEGVGGGIGKPQAAFARMQERSRGKDTTVGHWEIAGLVSPNPLPTFPSGFPADIIEAFSQAVGRGVLCNRPYSGTDVIRDFGEEHIRTGKLIVYTSADSVFQIAAHEDVVPVDELYRICETARRLLTGQYGVGRVIARPFTGSYPFTRTARRHDFSLEPTGQTMLDCLQAAGKDVISVGKISDIFAGRGITQGTRTANNAEGMQRAVEWTKKEFDGLCFINLVDFDMVYGHRNDIAGYAAAMTAFDKTLPVFLSGMREDDLLIITADHGCDPATPSTDHSREYTPMLAYGAKVRPGVNLGTRESFADISATVLDYLNVSKDNTTGESFLPDILVPDGAALLRIANEARKNSFSPYSSYRVGAALLTKNGQIFTGCNIESAAYSPTVCAERCAVYKALSEGEKAFAALAVIGGLDTNISASCTPCGVCRQVLSEFCEGTMPVYFGTPERPQKTTVEELLPGAFGMAEVKC